MDERPRWLKWFFALVVIAVVIALLAYGPGENTDESAAVLVHALR